MKDMSARNITFSHPTEPFVGLNFTEIVGYFRTVRSPRLCPDLLRKKRRNFQQADNCSLESRIDPVLDSLENQMKGLLLEDFPSVCWT